MSDLNGQMTVACWQQVKTIHRLLLVLADDLGDLSVTKGPHAELFGKLSDLVSGALEPTAQEIRDELEKLSR